jgi:predicted transglutaminase-like cysteine proteinase
MRETRRGVEYWAQTLGLLLVIAFVPPASAQPLADLEGFIFDPGEIEAVSFGEGSIHRAAVEPAPAAYSNPQAISTRPYRKAAALFGMETESFAGAAVSGKWSRVKAEISRERDIVARCHENGACPADAQKLIHLSAAGAGRASRAKIGLINRAVDLAIRPVSDDAQWGVPDHWSAPFETLRSSRGDCEDYALLKYLALLEAGVARDDVKIVILKNAFPREHHAVVAVRADGQWLILDNRTLTLVRDVDLMRATPEFVLDQTGVRRFVPRGRNHVPPFGLRVARSS